MKTIIFVLLPAVFPGACSSGINDIFASKSAREKYAAKVEKWYGKDGIAWKNAASIALSNPLTTPVPYAEAGAFHGDSADVASFRFSVDAGQKIEVKLVPVNSNFTAYTELWQARVNDEPKLLLTADTSLNSLEHPAPNGGEFILRIQPQVYDSGRYRLSILLAPLLGYPLAAGVKSSVGSVWGQDRNAGARRHEGIDIFAKKGSYVVAVENGFVYRVSEGGIGGKVVWLSPDDYHFSVYYAHLDSQMVKSGQRVKMGDVLGTVGNTGNARYTPSHLHFGIYTGSGAINPLNFIKEVPLPKETNISARLNQRFRLSAKARLYPSPQKKNAFELSGAQTVKIQSSSSNFYRVITESGLRAYLPVADITDKMRL